MAASLAWGLIASSSLVIGGVLALRITISRLVLGLVMAFGAGVLLSAVAFELVEEAFDQSGLLRDVALGLFAGCAVFSLGDLVIDRLGGADRKRIDAGQAGGSPLAIVLGIVLDGIPESAVIGLTLADTMMPEAFSHGGKLAGVMTTLGFATAFAVSAFE